MRSVSPNFRTESQRFEGRFMPKQSAPSASQLVKIGNVRVPSDWQPFGGFGTYDEYDEVCPVCLWEDNSIQSSCTLLHAYNAYTRTRPVQFFIYRMCSLEGNVSAAHRMTATWRMSLKKKKKNSSSMPKLCLPTGSSACLLRTICIKYYIYTYIYVCVYIYV